MKRVCFGCSLWLTLLISGSLAASEPGTDDFAFLLGEWEIGAGLGPDGEYAQKSSGISSCDYTLKQAYIQCEIEMTSASGNVSQMISLHNYNKIYGHHESLYISSSKNWPIKVLGSTRFEEKDGATHWTNEFEFAIEDERTEWVRAEMVVSDGVIDVREYIKRSGEEGHDWRLEYRSVWRQTGE